MAIERVPSIDTSREAAAAFGANRALRLHKAVRRGVALWIRQSSPMQKLKNVGSALFQKGLLAFLRHFGIEPDEIEPYVTLYDDRGNSAREGVDRPNFDQLIESIEAGEVGVVLVAFQDRHSRNKKDSRRLYDALARQHGLVIEQGNIYDPGDATDRFFLEMQSLMAWFNNAQRTLRESTSKAALASALRLRIPLPRGLCWASPDDPVFVRCAKEAGLEDIISPEALREHQASSLMDRQDLYILPYPDAEIQNAVRLTVEWLLETRSLREVVRRIASHPAWPEPGQFPAARSRLFRRKGQDEPTRRQDLWSPIVDRPDGRDDLAPGVIRAWLASPALFGIYSYDLPSLQETSPAAAEAIGASTYIEGAFPALVKPALRGDIESILRDPMDSCFNRSYEGPRNHALSNVRCAAYLPEGEQCLRKCSAAYRTDRESYLYIRAACRERGHQGSFSSGIDKPVLEMVVEAYRESELQRALVHIRERRGVADQARQRVERELRELEGQVDSASAILERAQQRGEHDVVEHWSARLEEHIGRKNRLQGELVRLGRQIERAGTMEEHDLARLRDLATDVPRVLEMAAKVEERYAGRVDHDAVRHEGLRRRVLAQLISGVFVRSLGFRCIDVEVEFPSGACQNRVVFVGAGRVVQPAAAFAYAELGERAEPENRNSFAAERAIREAARAAARVYNGLLKRVGRSKDAKWDADKCLTAALQHTHLPADVVVRPEPAEHESVAELATRLDLSTEEVLAAGLTGALGPARVREGEVVFRPTSAETHASFPTIARRSVAAIHGWDLDDTVLIADIRREREWSRKETLAQVRRWASTVLDEAGRQYTRRSCLPPEGRRELLASLNAHLPSDVDPSTGRWLPVSEAAEVLSVHRNTVVRYRTEGITVVRPGRGYLGKRSVYVWVDGDLADRCATISR